MRTFIYIDGFNLYYDAVRGTPYKWLDLDALCRRLLPGDDVTRIKYFTAQVQSRENDPGQATRQQIYLRALRTIPHLEIIYGHFLSNEVQMRLANPPRHGPRTARVIKTEEKGSDVNLALHLLHDGHRGQYEQAVVISNDSDLRLAIRLVTRDLRLSVGAVSPYKRLSQALRQEASFVRTIREAALRACQFPTILTDANGQFHKPESW